MPLLNRNPLWCKGNTFGLNLCLNEGLLTPNLSEKEQFPSAVFRGAYVGHGIFPPLRHSFLFPFIFAIVFKAFLSRRIS